MPVRFWNDGGMILTVTPNPAIDLTWHTPRLEVGETHRVPTALARAGGKGLNVARVLNRVGIPVGALTTAGGATGQELGAELTRSGIATTLVPIAGDTRRSAAFVDEATGEATVLNEHGPELSADEASAFIDRAKQLGREADAVAISGSIPPGLDPELVGELVADLVSFQVPVVADVTGEALLAGARAGATVLKPNRAELRETTGIDDPIEGARYLHTLGALIVVVSLGEEGMLVLLPDGSGLKARLPKVLHGNPTGAGDAAVAAIVSSLGPNSADLERLARRAVAWSASAVLMPAAGELHESWPELADEVEVEVLSS